MIKFIYNYEGHLVAAFVIRLQSMVSVTIIGSLLYMQKYSGCPAFLPDYSKLVNYQKWQV